MWAKFWNISHLCVLYKSCFWFWCQELDFGLEFERNGFEECFIFSEGSSKPIRDNQVIGVAEGGLFFKLNI